MWKWAVEGHCPGCGEGRVSWSTPGAKCRSREQPPSPKSSGERQPVSLLCVSWGRRALPMVFARSCQPARALPMYVPLCRSGARTWHKIG